MKYFRFACKQIVPISFAYIFVGLAYGVLMIDAGFSPLIACVSSAAIYAGSMQIVLISLLSAGLPLYSVAVMTLLINGRHLSYGLGLIDRFRAAGWRRWYMMLTVTDETYSVLCGVEYPPELDPIEGDFSILLIAHLRWIVGATLGASIGAVLPMDMTGIEFSATAFFVTVVLNQWRSIPSHAPALCGFGSAIVVLALLGPDNFILPSLAVSLVVLMVLRSRIELRLGGAVNA